MITDLKERVTSSIIMITVLAVLLLVNQFVDNGFILLFVFVALLLLRVGYEVVLTAKEPNITVWGLIFLFIIATPVLGISYPTFAVFICGLLALFTTVSVIGATLIARTPDKDSVAALLSEVSINLLLLWLFGLGGSALLLLSLSITSYDWITFITIIAAGDSAAYFAGKKFGRKKFSALVSPGKTMVGAVAFLGAAIILSLIFRGFSLEQGLLLGLTISFAAQTGDLAKSLMKRYYGVKDFPSLIPGHGGAFDRLDGYLGAAPIFLVFLSVY